MISMKLYVSFPTAADCFGGTGVVKMKLVAAFKQARLKRELSPGEADICCGLGQDGTPGFQEIEENPALLRGKQIVSICCRLVKRTPDVVDALSDLLPVNVEGSTIPDMEEYTRCFYRLLVSELDAVCTTGTGTEGYVPPKHEIY